MAHIIQLMLKLGIGQWELTELAWTQHQDHHEEGTAAALPASRPDKRRGKETGAGLVRLLGGESAQVPSACVVHVFQGRGQKSPAEIKHCSECSLVALSPSWTYIQVLFWPWFCLSKRNGKQTLHTQTHRPQVHTLLVLSVNVSQFVLPHWPMTKSILFSSFTNTLPVTAFFH